VRPEDFDYELPPELIAQEPPADRAGSRLLVLDRRTGDAHDRRFTDLAAYLRPGDCLVLNDTRVIPARLHGRRADGGGGEVELLLIRPLDDQGLEWEAMGRPGRRLRPETRLTFGRSLRARITGLAEDGHRVVRFGVPRADDRTARAGTQVGPEDEATMVARALDDLGQVPLPPYITQPLEDRGRYQTVYARRDGAVAAPTAGLHFTTAFLDGLREQGVLTAFITLHVGPGTFVPVRTKRVEDHRMHAERYEIDAATAAAVNRTRRSGGRVVAVGTTSVRALESAVSGGVVRPGGGWARLFIYPGYEFSVVDVLLTNFHLPRSTLLMLVAAFAGRERVLRAYRLAVERRYRLFSFGDAMLII